jgi:hypothetical protein
MFSFSEVPVCHLDLSICCIPYLHALFLQGSTLLLSFLKQLQRALTPFVGCTVPPATLLIMPLVQRCMPGRVAPTRPVSLAE